MSRNIGRLRTRKCLQWNDFKVADLAKLIDLKVYKNRVFSKHIGIVNNVRGMMLSFTCSCFSSVGPRFWSDGQFDTQSLALIMAGVIY